MKWIVREQVPLAEFPRKPWHRASASSSESPCHNYGMNAAHQYFDNAATTPLDPRVRAAMLPFLDDAFGNAHSLHSWGLHAHEAVDKAREKVARLIEAEDPSQIYFTSGATESNNWVLSAADEIRISPFE